MAKQFSAAAWKLSGPDWTRTHGGTVSAEGVRLGAHGVLQHTKVGVIPEPQRRHLEFLADVCRSFDLLAVQEIMDDLSGLRRLMSLLGPGVQHGHLGPDRGVSRRAWIG